MWWRRDSARPTFLRGAAMSKGEAILSAVVFVLMIGAWIWALWAIADALGKF